MFGGSLRLLIFLVYAKNIIVADNIFDTDCAFKCDEDDKCIITPLVCNGRRDCPHGSDESYMRCKDVDRPLPYTFYCANGAAINENAQCDNVIDCADGSDESPSLCMETEELDNTTKGGCQNDEIECLPGECLSNKIMCNGTIECTNGRDESVELCMETVFDDMFQCGNGKGVDSKKVCDNKFDCVDGSDELSLNCADEKNWRGIEPKPCMEPTERGLRFSNEVNYYLKNQTRFVYPNQGVRFECYDRSAKISGSQWDVCLTSGQWRLNNTQCRSMPLNNDSRINGEDGCPIETYDDKLMLIYECDDNKCETPKRPPLNDVIVRFACRRGVTMFWEDNYEEMRFRCENKKWSTNSGVKFVNPVCANVCNRTELFCSYSMTPVCEYGGVSDEGCRNRRSLQPGAKAMFKCNNGYYKSTQIADISLKCQSNGRWTTNTEMDKLCVPDCGESQNTKILLGVNSPTIDAKYSPWTVAIYAWRDSDFVYQCAGVRLAVDVVLTSAHCVTKTLSKIPLGAKELRVGSASYNQKHVGENYGWEVDQIKVNPHYEIPSYVSDIALLKLILINGITMMPYVACLPWKFPQAEKLPIAGQMVMWNTESDIFMNLTMASGELTKGTIASSVFSIGLQYGSQSCKGDSGSGFMAKCFNANKTCLYGLVSFSNYGENKKMCTDTIALSNIQHINNIEFIAEHVEGLAHSCKNG